MMMRENALSCLSMNQNPVVLPIRRGAKRKLSNELLGILADRWNRADANRRALAREFGMSDGGARAAVLRYLKEKEAEGSEPTTIITLPPIDQSPAVPFTIEDGTCPDAVGNGSLAA